MIKVKALSLILFVSLVFSVLLGTGRDASALNSFFGIEEQYQGANGVLFSVNTDWTNVKEFAIGNDAPWHAGIYFDNVSSPPLDWHGEIIWRETDESHNQMWFDGNSFDHLAWLNDVEEFDEYGYSFLFTSYDSGNYGSSLPYHTDGYWGLLGSGLGSPFAVYSAQPNKPTIITGETVHAASAPEPATIFLLTSGLLGLEFLRKTIKKR